MVTLLPAAMDLVMISRERGRRLLRGGRRQGRFQGRGRASPGEGGGDHAPLWLPGRDLPRGRCTARHAHKPKRINSGESHNEYIAKEQDQTEPVPVAFFVLITWDIACGVYCI